MGWISTFGFPFGCITTYKDAYLCLCFQTEVFVGLCTSKCCCAFSRMRLFSLLSCWFSSCNLMMLFLAMANCTHKHKQLSGHRRNLVFNVGFYPQLQSNVEMCSTHLLYEFRVGLFERVYSALKTVNSGAGYTNTETRINSLSPLPVLQVTTENVSTVALCLGHG